LGKTSRTNGYWLHDVVHTLASELMPLGLVGAKIANGTKKVYEKSLAKGELGRHTLGTAVPEVDVS